MTIAHYRIVSKLGEGGMGEVWRATDTKLGRDVAIKILPEAFAADAGRIERFQREAQVLASLNHPNIAAIYGMEEGALVMELVEGPTLADRIVRGPLPVDEALAVARQIAEALESAHEKGIVHRDLKPANIKLTPQGRVKVLDFGLAKAMAGEVVPGDPDSSPTRTMEATLAGTILGTAAYMSPEQARAQGVDRRADIWAFGAVLYEMLTGHRAFSGKTTADILAAVLNAEPDDSLLPAELSGRIRYLLKRCLRKKLGERLRDIGEARIWIDEASEEASLPDRAPQTLRGRGWVAAVCALVAGALMGAYLWRMLAAPAATPAWRGVYLGGPSNALGPRISPDGKTLAFQAMVDGLMQVAVMKPETGSWTVLTRERKHGPVQEIAWSPDETRLYFSRFLGSQTAVYRIPVLGGEERLVLDAALNPEMLPDGSLLVLKINSKRRQQIHRFWPDTGRLEPLPAEVPTTTSAPLRTFPDGREAAYFGWPMISDSSAAEALYVLDLRTGVSRRIAPGLKISPRPEDIGFPMAITPDGKKVLLGLKEGDLRSIVAAPRSGSGPVETWLNFTQNSWYLDAAPDGALYMDQVLERPEVLRFPPDGGRPERLFRGVALGPALERSDKSLLLSSVFAGHTRVAIGRPGIDLTPVSETREEAGVSLTPLGESAVAFPLGPKGKQAIAIASLPDGRIVRRLAVPGGVIDSLASSPDGRRIFYVAQHQVWSIPAGGGAPSTVGEADSVAAGSGEVVMEVDAGDGYHLVRAPLSGREPVKVPMSSHAVLTGGTLHPAAVGRGGRVLVRVNQPDEWFYRLATVDLNSGRLNLIPVDYDGDIWTAGWTPDGNIVATGLSYSFTLWQMRH